MKTAPVKLLLLIAVLPAVVLTVSWGRTFLPSAVSMGPAGMAAAVSSLFARNGLVMLVLLVVLGSRNFLVERSAGLDRMLRGHRVLGMVTLGLLAAHVSLQFARFYILGGTDLVRSALLTNDLWEMVVGRGAFLLLVAAGIPAFLGARFRFPFPVWKPLHLAVYAAVPLGMVHAGFRGSTMGQFPQMHLLVFLAAVLAAASAMRLADVLGGKRRVEGVVSRVVPENHDTTSIYLRAGRDPGDLVRRRAGQFALVRIPRGRTAFSAGTWKNTSLSRSSRAGWASRRS